MKIKVITRFADKYNLSRFFEVGTVHDFPDERANDVVSRNLAVFVEPEEVKVEPTPEPAPSVEEAVATNEEVKPKRTRSKSTQS